MMYDNCYYMQTQPTKDILPTWLVATLHMLLTCLLKPSLLAMFDLPFDDGR